jgi:hypothetical protein
MKKSECSYFWIGKYCKFFFSAAEHGQRKGDLV